MTEDLTIREKMSEDAVQQIVAQSLVDLFNHAWKLGYASGFELGKSQAEVEQATKERHDAREEAGTPSPSPTAQTPTAETTPRPTVTVERSSG